MISFNIDYKNIKTELCLIGKKYDVDCSSQRENVTNERHCHPYTIFYDSLFKNNRNQKLNIAVFSLLNSNSLLMWNDYFLNSNIYGFEYNDDYINYFNKFIDDNIILSKIDIDNAPSNAIMYDLIIDDFTHLIEDQIKIIKNMHSYLKPGGIFIIEDIFKIYNEKDYIDQLGDVLDHFEKYYFVTLDHSRRNSTGWDNDKLFILIKKGEPIFKNCKRMTIITPSIRPENLIEVRKSINFKYVDEWIIVYDQSKIEKNPYLFDNDINGNKIKEYIFTDEGCSGNPQRNYALDNISNKNTYLYFLDDDNIIHSDLYKLLDIMDNNKLYTFDQENRINGNIIDVKKIDSAMFLIDYNICKNIRWNKHLYDADGYYIKDCYLKNQYKWCYINNTLSKYYALGKIYY